jgi:hypothetical protein
MLYGSHLNIAAMLHSARSHQLGKGHPNHTAVSILNHPSRLVYESQRVSAEMPRVTRSQGKGHGFISEMPRNKHPSRSVYGSHHDCAVMPMEERSQGKGQSKSAAMPRRSRPSPPVYGSLCYHAAMPIYDRSHLFTRAKDQTQKCQCATALKGRVIMAPQKCHSWFTLPHQFMGGSEETHSNVTGIALSHQLGKDIICTLIKPLLFLPFLLIYGSRYRYAAMSFRGRSHQIWAKLNPQKCQSLSAQYNQRLSTTRSNATT